MGHSIKKDLWKFCEARWKEKRCSQQGGVYSLVIKKGCKKWWQRCVQGKSGPGNQKLAFKFLDGFLPCLERMNTLFRSNYPTNLCPRGCGMVESLEHVVRCTRRVCECGENGCVVCKTDGIKSVVSKVAKNVLLKWKDNIVNRRLIWSHIQEIIDECFQPLLLPETSVINKLVNKVKKDLGQSDNLLDLGIFPCGSIKTLIECILNIGDTKTWWEDPKECPVPKKYPCLDCNKCLTLDLEKEIEKKLAAQAPMKGFGIWRQSRKLSTARPVQNIDGSTIGNNTNSRLVQNINGSTIGNNTNFTSNSNHANSNLSNGGVPNNGNTTTNIISGRKGRSNWRKMSYAEREALFLEVAIYKQRHHNCGSCAGGRLPVLSTCMCVNDSTEQFMVDLGREVWGEDRCIRGSL